MGVAIVLAVLKSRYMGGYIEDGYLSSNRIAVFEKIGYLVREGEDVRQR